VPNNCYNIFLAHALSHVVLTSSVASPGQLIKRPFARQAAKDT
jgi:hypothetical protein